MWLFARIALVLLAVLAFRGVRWAYVSFIVLGLAYFPAKVGFRLEPHACQLAFGAQLAVFSLTNYAHIVMFALFFLMSSAQFGKQASEVSTLARAALATLAMGALVELAQGVTGNGHCRLRDLIPDSAGIVLGATTMTLWHRARRFRAA
jgi:VanZ like protein